jgi:predicted DNA-binding transcriptional regulator YafY
MSEMILRQWAMLRALPRAPRKISVQALLEHLADAGFTTTDRTLQRDLLYLSDLFPISCDDAKPKGWFWSELAVSIELPGMDVHTALTLVIIEQSVTQVLPSSTYRHMQSWFEQARKVINSAPAKFSNWKSRICVIDRRMLFVTPKTDPLVQNVVYDGLLNGLQIEVTYLAISSNDPAKTYTVSPLGLVIRDRLVYLVCTVKTYKAPRLLAIHRIQSARLLENKVRSSSNIEIVDIAQKALSITQNDKNINLQLIVSPLIKKYLQEAPLSSRQTVVRYDDTSFLISADVQDSQQLRSWIRSLGNEAIVVKPNYLRQQLRDELALLSKRYSNLVS